MEGISLKDFVGRSQIHKSIVEFIEKAAMVDLPVLIEGETGTGKEMVARLIHSLSRRARKPFIAINCACFPEDLLESELFGYKRGAFTGAYQDKPGIFLLANEGSIFLDEIGEMPLAIQPKLLRAIEEKKILPLGDQKFYNYDARILSATNKNLSQKVKEKEFRMDLLYRLKLLHISIPPLRERPEDIGVLTTHFIRKVCRVNGLNIKRFTKKCARMIEKYDWPGNVRQLKNFIETVTLFSEHNIIHEKEFLKFFDKMKEEDMILKEKKEDQPSYKQSLELSRTSIIADALKKANGSIARAARLLNMSRQNLYYLIKKYNLNIETR